MTILLQTLNPVEHAPIFEAAWEWQNAYPTWLREAAALNGQPLEYEPFIKEASSTDRFHVAVLEAGCDDQNRGYAHALALFTGILRGDKTYEGSLICDRRANRNLVCEGLINILAHLTGPALTTDRVFAWVWGRNHPMRRLIEAAGMRRDGLRLYRGRLGGRPAEWLRYSITREAAYGKTQ